MNLFKNVFQQEVFQQAKEEKKVPALRLWWVDEKKSSPAGVAFYNETFGEYQLKINILPDTAFYLRPVSWEEGGGQYRVDVVIKKGGKFKCRRPVGKGHSGVEDEDKIIIELEPYTKLLVLSLEEKNGDQSHE